MNINAVQEFRLCDFFHITYIAVEWWGLLLSCPLQLYLGKFTNASYKSAKLDSLWSMFSMCQSDKVIYIMN